MNIIFLDINGVLIDNNPPFISNTFLFNSEAMTNLSKLIETTNSKIVISSNWKIGMKNPNNIYWIPSHLGSNDFISTGYQLGVGLRHRSEPWIIDPALP